MLTILFELRVITIQTNIEDDSIMIQKNSSLEQKMKRLLVGILLIPLFTLADVESSSIPTNTQSKTNLTVIDTNSSEKNSSRENRKNKKYNVSIGAGKELGINAGITGELSYFYDQSSILFFKYTKVDDDYRLGFDNSAITKLGTKQFFGNSLYYKVSGYYLSSDTKHFENTDNSQIKAVKSTFSELGASVSIGNQWHWDNFTIGADWVGLNRTLLEISKFKPPFERKNMNTVSALNIHLGYSF